MRVKYNQTPPPVIDEQNGEVRVTKQLHQVSTINYEDMIIHCALCTMRI